MSAPPFRMTVEAGKVREFAMSVRSSDPEHLGPDPVSPPTFLMAMSWWMGPEHNPLGDEQIDYSRTVHGEQEFVFHGEPPSAGTELEALGRIESRFTKPGKRGGDLEFIIAVTEFRDVATGRLVAEARGTSITTSQAIGESS
ncbi:MAG: hypothetical protein JWL64_1728 [Frankiales bacterium]|nr:hypothetical protein [Frankiales bacterium]